MIIIVIWRLYLVDATIIYQCVQNHFDIILSKFHFGKAFAADERCDGRKCCVSLYRHKLEACLTQDINKLTVKLVLGVPAAHCNAYAKEHSLQINANNNTYLLLPVWQKQDTHVLQTQLSHLLAYRSVLS